MYIRSKNLNIARNMTAYERSLTDIPFMRRAFFEMEKIIGIYKITSPTGKIYIGQSTDILKRFYFYKKLHCRTQRKLYNSFKKHGVKNHKFEIIKECHDFRLNELEKYYIELYQSFNSNNGLNLLSGGDSKIRMSDDTKNKIGLSNRGSRNGMYGRKITDEAKASMIRNNSGEHNYLSKLILNLETGIFYHCLREASESCNIIKGTLWAKINRSKRNNSSFIYV